ncbi:MAG: sensor histidine kinase [Alphaproteobacteria bacterium]|nr:sensor histidine kinase [Alphaproteobacteria bacterium]MBU1524989.1 sensor histidine kinase [Alphaproteobacteria bacterium]MBU2117820.1 sensor histidine kinase [Alphaproteobacteria bacterium]MBU2349862.1 sensor histidine kinase [Alphaproteobacteria bacterium]MBU2382481.1 sensor histidine kinase [Alphaproteobacteria bacterium]
MKPARGGASNDWGRWFGRPGRSLTRRLIWLASAWILAALVATGLVLTSTFKESALRRLGSDLAEMLDQVLLATEVTPGGVTTRPLSDQATLNLFGGSYWQVAEPTDGGRLRVLTKSGSLWNETLVVPPELPGMLAEASGENISFNAAGPDGAPLRVAATLKRVSGRDVVFMAAVDRTDVEADVRQFSTVAWTSLVLLGLGLVIAVFLQVQIGLRPLFALRNEIADVRKGKAARIAGDYPLEIAPLAQQVNRLLDHNQDVVERQRTHVGNLAHALKTPLSVMLAEAEGRHDQLGEVVRRQSETMRGQVEHHLRRARAAARAQGLGERTPVAEVVDELAVMLERVFQSKGVEIDWRAPDELHFLGERQDLQEILGNLMENACKWCSRRVRVSAGGTGLGQMVAVIEDDGPGLPADRLETVLKRGERLDETAPGSGLGLAIVDDLARAYGGRLVLGASDLGGLKATLDLPAAEA